jgi:hypothetical protein
MAKKKPADPLDGFDVDAAMAEEGISLEGFDVDAAMAAQGVGGKPQPGPFAGGYSMPAGPPRSIARPETPAERPIWLEKGGVPSLGRKPRPADEPRDPGFGPLPDAAAMKAEVEATKPVNRFKGFMAHMGRTVKEAPAKIAKDPLGAARSALVAMGGGMQEDPAKLRERLKDPNLGDFERSELERKIALLEENKQVTEAHPLPAMAGTVAQTAVAPEAAVTRLLAAPKVVGTLGKAAKATVAAGGGGFVGGVRTGLQEGKSVGQALEQGVDEAGPSAVAGTLGDLVTSGAARALKGAPEAAKVQRGQQLTKGADSTHSRRLMGKTGENVDFVDDFVERYAGVKKSMGNQKKMADVTDRIASENAAKTGPVYDKLDQVVGEVPVKDVVQQVDDQIAKIAQDYGGSDNLMRAFEEVKGRLLSTQKARKGAATMTHKDLRAWVTKLLKEETQTMGSLAETEKYLIKDALHEAGDQILKQRLKVAGVTNPELAADLATLNQANRDIAAALKINQAATNANAREFYAKKGGLGDAVAAGVAATLAGTGAGIPAAVGGYVATKVAPEAAKSIGRKATRLGADVATGKRRISPVAAPSLMPLSRRREEEEDAR